MKESLPGALKSRRLLLDGAMGTQLQEAGFPAGVAPEIWNVEAAEKVGAVHRSYQEAGADLIETNTFGGHPAKLGLFGLADRCEELNEAGVRLARRVAGEEIWVVASIGPAGRLLAPFGDLPINEARLGFERQAKALAAAGADAINIETMSDLVELRQAIGAALATGLPVMAEVSFGRNGRTMFGATPAAVGAFFRGFPLLAAGSNCGLLPGELAPLLAELGATWGGSLIAQPNEAQSGPGLGPAVFAAESGALVQAGAAIVGGCCGTTPAYIEALRGLLEGGGSFPAPGQPRNLLASRSVVKEVPILRDAPELKVSTGEEDLADWAAQQTEADLLVLDLTGVSVAPAVLADRLGAQWLSLTQPVVFHGADPEILSAAIECYPGRPGAAGPSSLAGLARERGALWL